MHFLDKLKAALFETTPLMIKPAVALVPVTAKECKEKVTAHATTVNDDEEASSTP